ncbi:MAG: cytochrome P460 family protein [Pseudomonadota bacterium]
MNSRVATAALVLILGLGVMGATSSERGFSPYVGADGGIALPEDFRREFAHLGSWFVPDGPASGFHDVYTQPESIAHYRETGLFPDGAVLVKELRASQSAAYTTGADVSSATGEIKQWFVMVKDTKGRFADNPLWGEGWGWALYKPDAPQTNVATDFQKDCIGCHIPAKDTDYVYVDAYPTLK